MSDIMHMYSVMLCWINLSQSQSASVSHRQHYIFFQEVVIVWTIAKFQWLNIEFQLKIFLWHFNLVSRKFMETRPADWYKKRSQWNVNQSPSDCGFDPSQQTVTLHRPDINWPFQDHSADCRLIETSEGQRGNIIFKDNQREMRSRLNIW